MEKGWPAKGRLQNPKSNGCKKMILQDVRRVKNFSSMHLIMDSQENTIK